jgi:hypothetical protein
MPTRLGLTAIAAGMLAIGVVAPVNAKGGGGGGHGFGGGFAGAHAFSGHASPVHPSVRGGFGSSNLPPGFSHGGKKGWSAGRPPGWSKGGKKGWSSTVPPGLVP